MSTNSLRFPFPIFNDIDGDPLDAGYIYIGTAGLDPTSNPISVYYDEALTIPAAQPIRTLNGFPSNSGSPARLYVGADDYSLTVKNKNSSLIYTSLNTTEAIGASLIKFTQSGIGAVQRTVQSKFEDYVSVSDFGVVGDGSTDDSDAFIVAASTGLPLYVPKGMQIKLSKTVTTTADIVSDGATILGYVTNQSLYPFIFNGGGNVVGLKFNGANCVNEVGAVQAVSNGVEIRNCKFNSFDGYAFYSGTYTNCIADGNIIDDCGFYPLQDSIYIHTNGIVSKCKVTNSKYKAISAGSGADNVLFEGNVVDTTTGAASVGLYFAQTSQNCSAISNVVKNTVDSSIKTSKNTSNNKIIGNNCEGAILSQGGQNNRILSNTASTISIFAHDATPDIGTHVIGNTCDTIAFGTGSLNDVYDCVVKDNIVESKIGNTSTSSCLRNVTIENNTILSGGIYTLLEESYVTAALKPGPVYVLNNSVHHDATIGSSHGIRSEGVMFTNDEATLIVVSNNYVKGEGSAVSTGAGVKSSGSEFVECENNIVTDFAVGVSINRLRGLRCIGNNATKDVTLGLEFQQIDSATYWPGSDFVIENNSGTRDEATHTFRRVSYNLSGKELYASAAPTTGYYRAGEYRLNASPSAGGTIGWICTTSGNPGTWKTFGNIAV